MSMRFLKLFYLFKKAFCNEANISRYKVKFPHTYSLQEEELILNTINTADSKQLNRIVLAVGRCKKMIAHRKKHGNFKSLDDVLEVEGFGFKILNSLCYNVLNPSVESNVAVRKLRQYNFVTPELSPEKLESLKTVVGVSLGSLSISWAGIDMASRSVCHWGHADLPLSPQVKRHHETQILEAAYEAERQIPKADTYVMESCVTSGIAQQPANVPIQNQRLQLSTMLLVLLNQKARERSELGGVVFQRSSLWCRLYGTLVGSERVCSQSVVQDMINGEVGPYSALDVPAELLAKYQHSTPIVKESMCSALLLTTSFIDVNVNQLPQCLSLLRGGVKRNK